MHKIGSSQKNNCPVGVDIDVWISLPEEIQEELLSTISLPLADESDDDDVVFVKALTKSETAPKIKSKQLKITFNQSTFTTTNDSFHYNQPSYFTDKSFAATSSSIDGRTLHEETKPELLSQGSSKNRNSNSGSTTTKAIIPLVVICLCKHKARLSQVQKQGVNQGRYYYSCSNRNNKCKYFAWGDNAPHESAVMNLQWERFNADDGWVLVNTVRGFQAADILQGGVGDCWFLSALAVIAERRDLIEAVVTDRRLQRSGECHFTFFLDGDWQPLAVDNYLPCKANAKRKQGSGETVLAYSQSRLSQLWVPLLEKAYAKAHHSYWAISGGFISEGMMDLTGLPCETICFSDAGFDSELTWARLLSFRAAHFPMGCSSAGSGEGIVGCHAYSILDVRELHDVTLGAQATLSDFVLSSSSSSLSPTTAAAVKTVATETETETLRVVRVRNPWGSRVFTGDLSAHSDTWTRRLQHLLRDGDGDDDDDDGDGHTVGGGGTFWMT